MAKNIYSAPNSYWLIYGYTIPGSVDHGGLIKVGDTTFASDLTAEQLRPDCAELRAAAKKRIDEQTGTAGVHYEIVYTELAARWVGQGASRYLSPFRDHDVHNVLENSGFKHVKIRGAKGREWFRIDVGILKHAIKATKECRVALNSDEFEPPPKFVFRKEQVDAIEKTLKRFAKHDDMLWDAKMRFGKTPTALEVVRRGEFRKTIIITHRPVVGTSWKDDYGKVFAKNKPAYEFVDKYSASNSGSAAEEANKRALLKAYDKSGKHFIYFASIQDLRGSKQLGGEHIKNETVFDMEWDLVIIDEAHEGTQTDLGKKVAAALKTQGHTKVLSLSGTPFNILGQYDEDAVFVWDYTQEQATKLKWAEEHPDEPNPYAVLPRMNIYTFDLSKVMNDYAEEELEGKAFNFTEFFRVWTGDKDADGRPMPAGVKVGDFIHADDVRKFLDLISENSDTSRYPFSTPEYCDFFRHSLWMVPGVAAAKALSEMLRKHKVFKTFGVANVAGNGDDYEEYHYDDALAEVRSKIKAYPRTITLSCGKLTTGVTVPEWTAVLMISGSVHTAASAYMQTIFRVQSPWVHDGQMKEECYVFDFAPDRTLTVLTETAQLSRKVNKDKNLEERGRSALAEFINFCPVIAIEGGRAQPYDVKDMMRRLKHVFVMKAIRNGFDDVSIYNNDKLLKLGKLDLMKFNDLEKIVGKTKQTEAPNSVDMAQNKFDKEEYERKKKEKEARLKRKLTPEEQAALKEKMDKRKQAKNARSILRAISIRMPLLIYGADVPVDETISIKRFVELVDDVSWEEFMPKGVDKKRFNDFIEYYDQDVFEAAGLQIRRLAKQAEKLMPGKRVQQIAKIFGYFKNPDKETVLTPWRVVNMHLSDTLGGWCFFGEDFDPDPMKLLEEPRYVDRGEVTRNVFRTDAKILEINSKSGLYPLYMAYSLYRARCGDLAEDEVNEIARVKKWREVVRDNVFVVCKTPMAVSITRRTLIGYIHDAKVNAICWPGDLVETLKTKPKKFTAAISRGKFWKKEDAEMKFDAVVGNPPYQQITGGGSEKSVAATQATPIFNLFVNAAKAVDPQYASLIIPARWYSGGMGLNDFRNDMLHDKRISKLVDFADSRECFNSADIAGGICYFLYDHNANGNCEVVNVAGKNRTSITRGLDDFGDIFIRNNKAFSIIKKVKEKVHSFLDSSVSAIDAFGFPSKTRGKTEKFKDAVKLIHSNGIGYLKRSEVRKNSNLIDKFKVTIGILVPCNGEVGVDPSKGFRSITIPRILEPNEVTTFSYLVLGSFETRREAENFKKYMLCKFPRFMLRQTYSSMHIARQNFMLVPTMDFKKSWTDEKLYEFFGFDDKEREVIETTMRELKSGDEDVNTASRPTTEVHRVDVQTNGVRP